MSFLDNIGKKASEASVKAIQKTKDLSDMTRINSMISEEEKKMEKGYSQIGRRYVSMYAQECGEEFQPLVQSIIESEERINGWRKQVQDIKGIQCCTNCGAEVAKGAAFCSSCGSVMPKVQEPDEISGIRCKGCGAPLKQGVRFCTSCGMPVLAAESDRVVQEQSENDRVVQEQSVNLPSKEMRCPDCGAVIDVGSAFCTECGKKLQLDSDEEHFVGDKGEKDGQVL